MTACYQEGRHYFTMADMGRMSPRGSIRVQQEVTKPAMEDVSVTLHNDILNRTNSLDSEAYKVLGEALLFSHDPDECKIINYAIEHESINVSDALRKLTPTYWHTARAKLQRLVQRGILEFVSTKVRDPNSYYRLVRRSGD